MRMYIIYKIVGDRYMYYNSSFNNWFYEPSMASELEYDRAVAIVNRRGGTIVEA